MNCLLGQGEALVLEVSEGGSEATFSASGKEQAH